VFKNINDNLKDPNITNETSLKDLEDMRFNVVPVAAIVSKKGSYFINQTEKKAAMRTNTRILKDPGAYEVSTIENMRAVEAYHTGIADEKNAVEADKQKAEKAAKDMLDTDLFRTVLAANVDAIKTVIIEKILPAPGLCRHLIRIFI
jgi:hypothetical protein